MPAMYYRSWFKEGRRALHYAAAKRETTGGELYTVLQSTVPESDKLLDKNKKSPEVSFFSLSLSRKVVFK